jgi:2-polyprenyl-3-methyl-5-hydroxy-6-metoxy-1,4-benzoquinol methylase
MKKDLKIITQEGEMGNIQSSLDYFLKFNLPKEARILDIGCNYGSLIFNLYNLGYKNVRGVEIDKDAIEKGKIFYPDISIKLSTHEAGNLPFEDNSFDVALMFDVIEHVPNVQDFLKHEVHRVLKKGGTFIFQTPNKIINIPWEILNQYSFTKWKGYHCSLQVLSSLKKTLIEGGFSSVIIEKGNILTEHNKNKVKRKMGYVGIPLLMILQKLPLSIFPNFWGSCRK